MKTLAIIATMLIAATTLPTQAQGTTTNICDRTPRVVSSILTAASSTDCAAVDLANITILSRLAFAGLTSLKADDFAGLINLESLDLRLNKLTMLPDGVFDELDTLEWLNLGNERSLSRRYHPTQGDWRLRLESDLDMRVLAFVRANDGFLTAMRH